MSLFPPEPGGRATYMETHPHLTILYAPILSPCFFGFTFYYSIFPLPFTFSIALEHLPFPFHPCLLLPAAAVHDRSRCVATPPPKALYKLLYFRAIAASQLLKPQLLSCDSIVINSSVCQRRRAKTNYPRPPALCIR